MKSTDSWSNAGEHPHYAVQGLNVRMAFSKLICTVFIAKTTLANNSRCMANAPSLSSRHPVPTSRPRFSEVCTFLNSTDEVLLNWSNADKAIGARVMEIGAPLSEGNNLYLDLQYMYTIPQGSNRGSNVSITAV